MSPPCVVRTQQCNGTYAPFALPRSHCRRCSRCTTPALERVGPIHFQRHQRARRLPDAV
eukprot:COSAG02_NODE_47333_length_342_cov_0.613169_1_plen_58_part_10